MAVSIVYELMGSEMMMMMIVRGVWTAETLLMESEGGLYQVLD